MTREEFEAVLRRLVGPEAADRILRRADDSGDYAAVLQAVINGRLAADRIDEIADRQREIAAAARGGRA